MANSGSVRLGPVGEAARRNIMRLRTTAGLSLAELSARMTGDRQISLSGLSKIENGGRKLDVDDLVAIAAALDVTPLAILFGTSPDPDEHVQAGGTAMEASSLWSWAVGDLPLLDNDRRGFQARSLPWWLNVRAVSQADVIDSDDHEAVQRVLREAHDRLEEERLVEERMETLKAEQRDGQRS